MTKVHSHAVAGTIHLPIKLFWHVYQNLIDPKHKGLFLNSQFCSIDLCSVFVSVLYCLLCYSFLLSLKWEDVSFLNLAFFLVLCIVKYREGNGTPLEYSCLENPMDGGAW